MVIYHIDKVILDIDLGDEANDMGDDSINTVISLIDMGYLVTVGPPRNPPPAIAQVHSVTRHCCFSLCSFVKIIALERRVR
jgi:hypothetical protein